ASRACDYFSVVLSPDSDRYHYNHLHFDIGPWRLCQTHAKTPTPTASGKIDSGRSP
ncbi:MAG TPA: extensin family protein, partial [Stellaceae bacterium]|nr:extensin family protein [Stellaceae bacterium]